MDITITQLTRLLRSALGSYPSQRNTDPYKFAQQYHSILSSFSVQTVQNAVQNACEESDTFFPSAQLIAKHCRKQKQMNREQNSELSELNHRLRKAQKQGDHGLVRELSAAIAQHDGHWRPKSVEEQRADYLAATPKALTPNPAQDDTANEILGAHRSYWTKRVQDVARAAQSRHVSDTLLATIATQSVNQILEAGDEARGKVQTLSAPSWIPSRISDMAMVAAMGTPANGRISHEDGPSIEFV